MISTWTVHFVDLATSRLRDSIALTGCGGPSSVRIATPTVPERPRMIGRGSTGIPTRTSTRGPAKTRWLRGRRGADDELCEGMVSHE